MSFYRYRLGVHQPSLKPQALRFRSQMQADFRNFFESDLHELTTTVVPNLCKPINYFTNNYSKEEFSKRNFLFLCPEKNIFSYAIRRVICQRPTALKT